MHVLFESRHPEGQTLRDFAIRRTVFVMRRVVVQVPRARVLLSDVNGPRGGVDKHCQIELVTDGAGPVVTHATARNWRSALDSALARAARVLKRLLRRGREPEQQARPVHKRPLALTDER
jgi:predicted ATP-grasp superfamily ATP-dependent carboligase